MLEFYISYADYNYLMDFTEKLVTHLSMEIAGTLRIPYGDDPESVIDFTPPWPRLSIQNAMEKEGVSLDVFKSIDAAKEFAAKNNIDIAKKASLGKILDEIFKEKVEPK